MTEIPAAEGVDSTVGAPAKQPIVSASDPYAARLLTLTDSHLSVSWQFVGTTRGDVITDKTWATLRAWIAWLTDIYEIANWPTCWDQHLGLVQHAAALQADYIKGIGDRDPHAVVALHEDLERLVTRAKAIDTGCGGGGRHRRVPTAAGIAMQFEATID